MPTVAVKYTFVVYVESLESYDEIDQVVGELLQNEGYLSNPDSVEVLEP